MRPRPMETMTGLRDGDFRGWADLALAGNPKYARHATSATHGGIDSAPGLPTPVATAPCGFWGRAVS